MMPAGFFIFKSQKKALPRAGEKAFVLFTFGLSYYIIPPMPPPGMPPP